MARPSRPCIDCPALIAAPNTRCVACLSRHRKASRQRNPRTDQAYSTSAWRTRRARWLAAHPDCAIDGCARAATDVDHVIPRRILVAAGVSRPDDDQWLQSLCGPHHSRKTLTIDKPLLARLGAGDDAATLAQEALDRHHGE